MTYPDASATTTTHAGPGGTPGSAPARHRDSTVRKSTETKAAFKTTEFISYIACVAAIAIVSLLVGDDTGADAAGGNDYFLADKAMLLITIVTVGYLISRGLAKSGSRDFYDDDRH